MEDMIDDTADGSLTNSTQSVDPVVGTKPTGSTTIISLATTSPVAMTTEVLADVKMSSEPLSATDAAVDGTTNAVEGIQT